MPRNRRGILSVRTDARLANPAGAVIRKDNMKRTTKAVSQGYASERNDPPTSTSLVNHTKLVHCGQHARSKKNRALTVHSSPERPSLSRRGRSFQKGDLSSPFQIDMGVQGSPYDHRVAYMPNAAY